MSSSDRTKIYMGIIHIICGCTILHLNKKYMYVLEDRAKLEAKCKQYTSKYDDLKKDYASLKSFVKQHCRAEYKANYQSER
jgi:hypothetical protein